MLPILHRRSPAYRLARVALVLGALLCLMSESLVAVGCEVHDIGHGSTELPPDTPGHETGNETAPEHGTQGDDCHVCCGSSGSGHLCTHGVPLTASLLCSAFVPQHASMLPPSSARARAQFIPPGMFRPPIAV
jgi:hypothetical protein